MTDSQKIRRLIKGRQAMMGYSNSEMACYMHMSLSSWNRRLKDPRILTVKDLIRLENVLKFKLLEVKINGSEG